MPAINRLLSGGLPVRPTGGSGRKISQETLDFVLNNESKLIPGLERARPRPPSEDLALYPMRRSEPGADSVFAGSTGRNVSGNVLPAGQPAPRAKFDNIPRSQYPGQNVNNLNYTSPILSKKEALAARNYQPSGKNLEYGPDPMMHMGDAKSRLGIDPLPRPGGALSAPTPAGAPMHGPVSLRDYDSYVGNDRKLSPFQADSALERRFIESLDDSFTLGVSKENLAALGRANERILEAQEKGSVVGMLRRQNELYNQGKVRGSVGGAVPQAGTPQGLEYGLLSNQIDIMERNALKSDLFSANPEAQQAFKRLFSGDAYDEAVHLRSNNATSTNAMNGSTKGPTPPSSSNMPIDPNTVPTGTTSYSGYYQPSAAPLNGGALGSVEAGGGLGIAASMGLGALVGGTANYATGGSFGEGAIMGGLAGGAIKIGSRAIAANETGIENYLQRTALGSEMTAGMSRDEAARLIVGKQTAGEGAGFMQNQAFNILKSQNPSMGMQSRYMVMGGSALSGIAFTGRRNDKRRGFNSHRGNRI